MFSTYEALSIFKKKTFNTKAIIGLDFTKIMSVVTIQKTLVKWVEENNVSIVR